MDTHESSRVDSFRKQGFFLVPALVEASECAALREACDRALGALRERSRETGHSTPRVTLDGDEVASFAGSPRVCRLLLGLARPGEESIPRLKDVHYYHEPTRRDWDGDWHRDSQFSHRDLEAERAVVEGTTSVHVRVALEDDDRLEIVPGSHARWDTPEELRVRKGAERATARMPTAHRVVLRRGDGCVFHAWSIHRATYRRVPVRRTLDFVFAFGAPS